MRHLLTPIVSLGLISLVSRNAAALGTVDPASGTLRPAADALRVFDFETAESLTGMELTTWSSRELAVLKRTTIRDPAAIRARLTEEADSVEGSHALRLGDGDAGLAITEASLIDSLHGVKFEASLWARADGVAPTLMAIYDHDAQNLFTKRGHFAEVHAIRTGRETDDGWAEFSTGVLDGNVLTIPLRALVVTPSLQDKGARGSFLIDALEIRKVSGGTTPRATCTTATTQTACGSESECLYGHCVPSAFMWGVLPPPSHRNEIVERTAFNFTVLQGNRAASDRAERSFKPEARALAKSSSSSGQFFGGLNRLTQSLRDAHTDLGRPSPFYSQSLTNFVRADAVLGACFGVMEKDLLGGGLGFGVFSADQETPPTGKRLEVGDVLTAIDGEDPIKWLDRVFTSLTRRPANDPAADMSNRARALHSLLGGLATTVTVTRCASATACSGQSRQELTINVADAIYRAITDATPAPTSRRGDCSPRFRSSVATAAGSSPGGGDVVNVEQGPSGETRVQFDGFDSPDDTWSDAMAAAFKDRPKRAIMDARAGYGGRSDLVGSLLNLLRAKTSPIIELHIGRPTYDLLDPPWMISRAKGCGIGYDPTTFWRCGTSFSLSTTEADPPGALTRIAWLNTQDGSSNDQISRGLRGRSDLRIFAPHATIGAFGTIGDLPAIAAGWSSGTVAITDNRFAADFDSMSGARWESGHGVEPDTVVAQKLSDALRGIDTIVETATRWLLAP